MPASIEASAESDFYTLTGTAGDLIELTLVETGGVFTSSSVDPHVTVFSPTSVVVTSFVDNTQQQITLPETGTYLIRVMSEDLVNTGSYTLQLECTAPTTPQNVQAIAGDAQVTISWDAVTGATSYNIYWNTTQGALRPPRH